MADGTTRRAAGHLVAGGLALASVVVGCTSTSDTATSAEAGAEDASNTSRRPDSSTAQGTGGSTHDAHAPARPDGASPRDASPDARSDSIDGGRHYSTDRSTFFGTSRCAAANVQLCEDFESGTLDTSTWQVTGDVPTIDGVQKARGNRALHITKQNDGAAFIREKKTFPEPGNTYWGRLFVYFEQLPIQPMDYAHWTFIAASGTGVSGEIRVSGQRSSGDNWFGVGTDNRTDPEGTGDWTTSDHDPGGNPKAVPLHQWLCVEWMHSGRANETRFFLDGMEHPSLHTTETMNGGNGKPFILPQLTNVWVGWQEYQTSTETFELWMDEVAIDGARIGCDI